MGADVRIDVTREGLPMQWPEERGWKKMFFPWEFVDSFDNLMDGGLHDHRRFPASVATQLVSFKGSRSN